MFKVDSIAEDIVQIDELEQWIVCHIWMFSYLSQFYVL